MSEYTITKLKSEISDLKYKNTRLMEQLIALKKELDRKNSSR